MMFSLDLKKLFMSFISEKKKQVLEEEAVVASAFVQRLFGGLKCPSDLDKSL